jgi:hypothetical protein
MRLIDSRAQRKTGRKLMIGAKIGISFFDRYRMRENDMGDAIAVEGRLLWGE